MRDRPAVGCEFLCENQSLGQPPQRWTVKVQCPAACGHQSPKRIVPAHVSQLMRQDRSQFVWSPFGPLTGDQYCRTETAQNRRTANLIRLSKRETTTMTQVQR